MSNAIDIRIKTDREAAMNAAMCIWEWALEQITGGVEPLAKRAYMDGTADVRDDMMHLAESVDAAYQIARYLGYDDCFDWEFVPAVLQWVVIEEGTVTPCRSQWISAIIFAMEDTVSVADVERAIAGIVERSE